MPSSVIAAPTVAVVEVRFICDANATHIIAIDDICLIVTIHVDEFVSRAVSSIYQVYGQIPVGIVSPAVTVIYIRVIYSSWKPIPATHDIWQPIAIHIYYLIPVFNTLIYKIYRRQPS